ncbi:acylphosphatase [Legionella longbeachae]|uniref:acylphosphatase n=1 Tax=Legionella longbeachae serogroup 1 (strain NSW150) TaxID=661367 RepID=D3HR53_LEGLN|nr:acylphosphatase [Legionella longbeachae]VEE01890.1 acylphosphatase [Legionella oakridgensis]HBD7396858.1 acylphosphatase [Legionella pneumophila]ARB91792.1 acylphosphatase [Legionella longbeachae]ARM35062.1 acylphosphatase [Legionella longbeachae]EEZ95512.1 acylphosphatase [Legionella longbeachae D-4968]
MTNQICIRCYVSGKVQGVWYRASAQSEARKLGISGWARNLEDGRVEVFACGTVDNLQIFYKWLKEGPSLAVVKECTYEEHIWQEYGDFDTF